MDRLAQNKKISMAVKKDYIIIYIYIDLFSKFAIRPFLLVSLQDSLVFTLHQVSAPDVVISLYPFRTSGTHVSRSIYLYYIYIYILYYIVEPIAVFVECRFGTK